MTAKAQKEKAEDTLIPLTEDEWNAIAAAYNALQQKHAELEMARTLFDGRMFQIARARNINPCEYDVNFSKRGLVKKEQ